MSRARSGSDWAFKARFTSEGVKPGLRWLIHVSNCFSSGVLDGDDDDDVDVDDGMVECDE